MFVLSARSTRDDARRAAEIAAQFRCACERGLRVRCMVLPDRFIDQDSPNAMYAQAGLYAKGIVAKVFEALGKDAAEETVKLA